MKLDDNVLSLKGVGAARGQALQGLGIRNVKDLTEFYPRDYQDRNAATDISNLKIDEINTIRARVCGTAEVSRPSKIFITKIKFEDNAGTIEAVWFNQPYLKNYFCAGNEYILTGKVETRAGKLIIVSPDHEPLNPETLSLPPITPIYPLRDAFSQKQFRKLMRTALNSLESLGEDYISQKIRAELDLIDRETAINNIHFPMDLNMFFAARKRLVFDEILLLRLSLYKLKGDIRQESMIPMVDFDYRELTNQMPYEFTGAQARAIEDIINDFKSGMVMNRLVQGDVGCGKTAVACVAAYIAIKNGMQAAIMVPTEVLATQHYVSIKKLFDGFGIATELLVGSLKKSEKTSIYKKLISGEIQMLIGTHAVIQDRVEFRHLALVITDEQHRFGVRQRARLSEKGRLPHTLAMSATPIPRTLALVLYGDMDISLIDELPPGRQVIETYAVNSSYRERYISFIKKHLLEGRQAYVICAMTGINENDDSSYLMELENVVDYAEKLKNVLDGYKVEFLHGKMKTEEKDRIMREFAGGEIKVLVSTTVIEVGVNVPNATIMVIENAERFGLAQLHQLRGRVGRGGHKSYCVLVSDSKSETCKERLSIMKKTNDGFIISEKDLSLRGQGDFFGTRQHGLPEMKIANLFRDMDLLPLVDRGFNILTSESGFSAALTAAIDSKLKNGAQVLSL